MSTRRRILALLPFTPHLDAAHGGARVMAEQLEALTARHDVALLALRAVADPPLSDALRRRCVHADEIVRTTSAGGARELTRVVRFAHASVRGVPFWVADWSEPDYARRLAARLDAWHPDLVHCEYHVMGQYLDAVAARAIPTVLVEYEPGHAAALDRVRTASAGSRWLRTRDARAWARYERALLARVDATVAFTELDAERLAALAPDATIACIRPGFRVPAAPLDALGADPPRLLFFGNFGHPPNRAAALRLATRILPALRTRVPNACLRLVGDAPPAELRALADDRVAVTGRVPDMRAELAAATVVVVPITHGGGIRVKVLETLAAGKALVASPLAIAGLPLAAGEQCMIAESDDQFVAALADLVADPARRVRLAASAYAWARAHLGWDEPMAAWDALHARLLHDASPARADDGVAIATRRLDEARHG